MKKITLIAAVLITFSSGFIRAQISNYSANYNEKQIVFDIPSSTVGEALNEFAAQSGLQVVLFTEVGLGIKSVAIQSSLMSINDGLTTLLTDTGLCFGYLNVNTIAVQSCSIELRKKSIVSDNTSVSDTDVSEIEDSAQVEGSAQVEPARGTDDQRSRNGRNTIEEIVVTARKRAENLQDVPISISVFTSADIEAKSLTSLKELSQFTPNFSMFNNGNDGSLTSEVFIRGVGNSVGGPGVGIYLDGVYLSTQQGIDLDMLDVERIEVLRGPQGTLFGRNSIGGAVNVVTARPTDEFSGSAEVTYGKYERLDAKLNLNVPLIPGRLKGKIAVATQNRDGYGRVVDFFTGDKIGETGDRERLSGRIVLDWKLTDNIDVLLSVDAMDVDEKSTVRSLAGFTPIFPHIIFNQFLMANPPLDAGIRGPDIYTTYGAGDNFNELDSIGGSVTIDWGLGETTFAKNMALKSISSIREYDTGFGHDFDFSPHDFTSANNFQDHEQFSQELQLSGLSFDERLVWVAGLFYFNGDTNAPSRAEAFTPLSDAGFIPVLGFNLEISGEEESWAVFGQGTFTITDKLSITGGIRYTEDKKDGSEQVTSLIDGSFNCPNCLPPISGKTKADAVSGRASLEYKWNDDIMTFASAARGFKSGGLTASVTDTSQSISTLNEYLPEFVWTYEVGMRSTWLDNRLRLNVTGYFSDYEDIQYSFVFGQFVGEAIVPVLFVSNSPAAEIKGLELDVLFAPTENLTLTFGYGLTDGEYTAADQRGGPLTTDSEFVHTPKNSFTVGGDYSIPTKLGELAAHLDYAWNDKVFFEIEDTISPLLQQESYGLLNARISLAHASGWTVSVFGTNLTDEEYLLSAFALQDLGLNAIHQPASPREWGVSLSYDF